jgi:molecular chaperone GrpE
MRDLLPVLDDFNRIKKSWDEKHDLESFKKGFELVYDKFVKVLERQGLKEIDALGKPFDVSLHEALMQVSDKNSAPNTVTGIIENGYYLKDKVLRHAKVIVSDNTEEEKNK